MTVYVGLGSNLGDRARAILLALHGLQALPKTRVVRISSLYQTRPWGVAGQPDYYNLVAEIETGLEPLALLRHCLALESSLGRVRPPGARWAPRPIDLDLLWVDGVTTQTPELTLPHPRLLQRAFVLVPLAELCPGLPIEGRTVAEHLAMLNRAEPVSRDVRPLGPLPGWPPACSASTR